MPEVELAKMSGGALSKLRNGHPCRCALASKKGEGVSAIMGEGKIKEMLKAGKRGAKKTLSLSPEEIAENKAKGTGIMAGGRACGGKIKMKSVKKTLGKIARSKPVQAAKKAGLHELGEMAVQGAVEAGVPPPVAKAAVSAIEKKVDKASGGKIHMKKPKHLLNQKAVSATKDLAGGKIRVKKALKKAHVGRKAKNFGLKAGSEAAGDLGASSGAVLGGPVGAVLGKTLAQGAYAGATKGLGIHGGAIGPSATPESFVRFGSGGNLLPPRNPALRSQPDAANWEFHTQMPPALASQITGSGLYASGRGLYASSGSGLY